MQQQFLAHFVIDIIGIAHFIYIYVYGSEMICNLTCDNRLLMMIPPKMRLVPLFFFFFFFVQNALVFVILIIEYSRGPPPPPVPKARSVVWESLPHFNRNRVYQKNQNGQIVVSPRKVQSIIEIDERNGRAVARPFRSSISHFV